MDKKTDAFTLENFFLSMSEITEKSQKTIKEALTHQQQNLDLGVSTILQSWQEFNLKLLENPDQIVLAQLNYWQDYLTLCRQLNQSMNGKMTEVIDSPDAIDKRFLYEEWQNNFLFNFVKQTYLLMSNHVKTLVKTIAKDDEKLEKKLEFYAEQFMNAISPANFIATNPEVLQATLTSKGENLLNGFKQFLQDAEEGKGLLHIKITDQDYFKIGKNIAITPGKIIFQNDIMQLIQYQSSTDKVHQRPLLIIPPWINKYYVLDLQPENSFIKWIVDQGFSVFLISWVNPDKRYSDKQFSDYLLDGPIAALKIIEQITGKGEINTLGYCIGGTLLACAIAYLATQEKCPINSATFLTTLLDFSEPGNLGIFIDEQQISILEKHMKAKGYLDGNVLASVFSALRANDLIWSHFVHNYLKGKKPAAFDLLYWNSDSTNIPEKVHSFYLREMYLHNNLIKPNAMNFHGNPLDLSAATIPSYFLSTQDDHIVPWRSSYKGMHYLGGNKNFVLAASGHVAGVINPPKKNKYSYWTNDSLPEDPNKWLNTATQVQGSWWEDWLKWLQVQSGEKVSAKETYNKLKVIEEAPGSYVKISINDIN